MTTYLAKYFLAALLTIQAALSVVTFALCSRHQQFVDKYEAVSISLFLGTKDGAVTQNALPEHLERDGVALNIANGSLSIATCACLLIALIFANGNRRRVSQELK